MSRSACAAGGRPDWKIFSRPRPLQSWKFTSKQNGSQPS